MLYIELTIQANNSIICENKGHYYLYSNDKHISFSQKNKDKSNEVTLGFLNMI